MTDNKLCLRYHISHEILMIPPPLHTHTHTQPTAITDVVSGLKVQRTSDNSALVVTWEPIAMEMSAALPQIYELEYRLTSSSEGLLVIVGEDGPLAIEGLDDAASYKVHSNSMCTY